MKEQRYGRIVQVTSSAGLLGTYGMANYAAAKMGLVGLLRVIALEGERHGIRANLVAPGAVGTRMERGSGRIHDGGLHRPAHPLAPPDPDGAALMTPERVSPIITASAHQTCPYTGEIFSAFGGFFGRFVVATNKGWVAADERTSADDLVEHWEEIRDTTTVKDESAEDAFSYSVRIMNDQIRAGPAQAVLLTLRGVGRGTDPPWRRWRSFRRRRSG